MGHLLEQTAHLTFLGIFLIKSTILLTILSTLAITPMITPKVVKLIRISSVGKISRRSYTYHLISALRDIRQPSSTVPPFAVVQSQAGGKPEHRDLHTT